MGGKSRFMVELSVLALDLDLLDLSVWLLYSLMICLKQ